MELTKVLKSWLAANCDVKEDASDDEFRVAAGKAMAEGTLKAEKFMELTKPEEADDANVFSKKLDEMAGSIKDLTEVLKAKEESKDDEDEDDDEKKTELQTKDMKDVNKMIGSQGGTPTEPGSLPDVKPVKDIFSTTKSTMMYPTATKGGKPHPLGGQPVMQHGRSLDTPSDLDKAYAGAWAKFQLASVTPSIAGSASRAWEILPEIDKQLLHSLCENEMWDVSDDDHPRMTKGYQGGTKQLIDDVVSGGLEAAPIVFDDQVIETPLLKGELYPRVKEIVLSRGRRIEGVSIGTVTGGWGGGDATNIALFATAGYVAAFDTTIFRWEGAVQIGLDFISDTPIDFGSTITRQYGERLLEDLDDVIATGNGVNQPQGVMNAAGTTNVAFGGATTLGAYETLFFSVTKAERKTFGPSVFCGTETSYSRARGLNVTAADQRRLGGGEANQGDYDSFKWMGRDYAINESLTNQQIFNFVPKCYRMYRRKGFTVRTSVEGQTLIRLNEMLITVMARYGGQLERGACAAVTATAPA
jgi:HK97 family phage major capsid protein